MMPYAVVGAIREWSARHVEARSPIAADLSARGLRTKEASGRNALRFVAPSQPLRAYVRLALAWYGVSSATLDESEAVRLIRRLAKSIIAFLVPRV